jgi:hypothetical protein
MQGHITSCVPAVTNHQNPLGHLGIHKTGPHKPGN